MSELGKTSDLGKVGSDMYQLIAELYPICRSITGTGVRETLDILRKHIPIEIHNVPSGTQVFDWTIPKEWNITDAYVKNARGERVIDFQNCNLHVVNYSIPVHKRMSISELRPHLFTLPDHPDWVPYRTTYYEENWGFCLSHSRLLELRDEHYDVCINSSLKPGVLTYGEYLHPGETPDEVLISCHICHPSLANDNLSGISLAVFLAKHLNRGKCRYSYRFLFVPGTIGSITWLSQHEADTSRVKHGLVLASVGAGEKLTYKKSRRGNSEIDRAALSILHEFGKPYHILEFSPYGYDERQFCSPGFNLPMGCLMRAPNGTFPEYHTSADNLDFVRQSWLGESFDATVRILGLLENNAVYTNQNPKCEPQLGKRGVYRTLGGTDVSVDELALLWVLNFSDGTHSLLDIADHSGLSFESICRAAALLRDHDLIK